MCIRITGRTGESIDCSSPPSVFLISWVRAGAWEFSFLFPSFADAAWAGNHTPRLAVLCEFGVLIYQQSTDEDWNKLWRQDREGDGCQHVVLRMPTGRLCFPLFLQSSLPSEQVVKLKIPWGGVRNVVTEKNLRTITLYSAQNTSKTLVETVFVRFYFKHM